MSSSTFLTAAACRCSKGRWENPSVWIREVEIKMSTHSALRALYSNVDQDPRALLRAHFQHFTTTAEQESCCAQGDGPSLELPCPVTCGYKYQSARTLSPLWSFTHSRLGLCWDYAIVSTSIMDAYPQSCLISLLHTKLHFRSVLPGEQHLTTGNRSGCRN